MDGVLVREAVSRDLPFIMARWLRDLRDQDPGTLPDDLFFAAHRQMLERLLSARGVLVRVAVDSEARPQDEILGFAVASPEEVLWWVHVRRELRGRGLARLLLDESGCPPGTPSAWRPRSERLRTAMPPRGRLTRRHAACCATRPETAS